MNPYPVIEWLINGRVGASSKTMAGIALGLEVDDIRHPSDPDDFNRCLLLLKQAPEVRLWFPSIAAASPEWDKLIDRWDEIEKSFLDEAGFNWSKSHTAPKTYELMREIFG